MGERFHLALLILGKLHNQWRGHRFEPLHRRAVEIDVGNLVPSLGGAALCNDLGEPLEADHLAAVQVGSRVIASGDNTSFAYRGGTIAKLSMIGNATDQR